MTGITMGTALEIFTNPRDLQVTIAQELNGGGKFGFGIFRGPGHGFKPLLTSAFFAEALEEAVQAVRGVLETTVQVVMKEFGDIFLLSISTLTIRQLINQKF